MEFFINGLMIVRLPHHNKDYLGGRGAYSAYAPKIGDIYYGGIERMPWFDILEDFYSGRLPTNIKSLWLSIKEANVDLPNISLTQNLDDALNLLAYCNRSNPFNEIIAVHSNELIEEKGGMHIDDSSITWSGYDIVAWPEWSLLHAGLFQSPASFSAFKKYLNKYGLFSELTFLDDYVEAYHQASLKNEVEEVWRLDRIIKIQVGRLKI